LSVARVAVSRIPLVLIATNEFKYNDPQY
jgi:hypothetical protein